MITTEQGKNKIINDLARLTKQPGWKFLTEVFSFRIKELQDQINTVGGNEIKFSEKDIKIKEMTMLAELLESPAQYIKILNQDALPEEEMDPYEEENQ